MLVVLDAIIEGYNEITNMQTRQQDMLMDIGIQKIKAGIAVTFLDGEKESALLLLDGAVEYSWDHKKADATRASVFDENPLALHTPAGMAVTIYAKTDAEVLIQKTTNDRNFEAKFYGKEDCTSAIFYGDVWNDTARRLVRTVFDYKNAPYSNMVLGEVISFPGKWSSYIPHRHDQPEVYFYRFDKDSGFGAGFIGEDVYKTKNNSALCIPGGFTHPQVTAPGYPMYFCWMIRHLDQNPWTSRNDDDNYLWLLEDDVKIWPNR